MDRDFYLRAIVVAKPGAVAAYIAWLQGASPADPSDEAERFRSTASPRSDALAELLRPGSPALAKIA